MHTYIFNKSSEIIALFLMMTEILRIDLFDLFALSPSQPCVSDAFLSLDLDRSIVANSSKLKKKKKKKKWQTVV